MTNYKLYDSYEMINKGWLESIPNGWGNASLKWISRRYSGGTPDKNNPEYWQDGEIPWLNSGEVNQEVITKPSTYISIEGFKSSSAKWVPVDGLLMALAGQGKTKGMVAQTKIRTTCNQSMAAIVINKGIPKFFYWWLNSQYKNIRGLTSDEGRDGLNLEMVGSIICPIPSKDEQQKIADFLDYKTLQIDALIAKKETLLLKLQEKRSALITQVVTKGINSNTPLKPSGVEWLGDVPAHWDVKRMRFSLTTNPSKNEIDLEEDDLVSFIPMEAVGEYGGLTLETEKEVSEIGSGYTYFKDEDVVVAKITPCFENGKGAIAKGLKNQTAFGTTELHVLRVSKELNPDFLFQITISYPFRKIGESEMYGAGGQKRVPETFIKDFKIGFPPLAEQLQIVEYIKLKNDYFERQFRAVSDVITKLIEYRTALITNAVTGKIDVRDFNIPQKA